MSNIKDFFDKQLSLWEATRQRYADLQQVQTRTVGNIILQFNPARIVSTGAKIDKQSLEERPCFLCRSNRPKEQIIMDLGNLELLVNPFPILPRHFTIVHKEHQPQSIRLLFPDIRRILSLDSTLMVFYNGPHCGASAPDHAHLQAGTSGLLPIQKTWADGIEWLEESKGARFGLVKSHSCIAYAICATDAEEEERMFYQLYNHLPIAKDDYEPMLNIVAWIEDGKQITIIFPRGKHRPDCYYREGSAQHLVSPGALDMGGLIITPRKEDFDGIDADTAAALLCEVALNHAIRPMRELSVGIVSAQSLRFTLNGVYNVSGANVSGAQEALFDGGSIMWNGKACSELLFKPCDRECSFSLQNVIIGVNFHWERTQTQTFRGTLRLIINGDKICAINILPVEWYLESVISSEMSATSSLELLKAHTVISRSWVLAQIENKKEDRKDNKDKDDNEDGNTIIRWYDHDDHTLFDVCADDHCQRYQGITNAANPHVAEAVRATCGQVMMYDGEICDTRFSKCCGGITEEYQYCWENIYKPYLRSVSDPYCNTNDPAILSEVLNDYDQETHDFYRWSVAYTQAELSALIRQKTGKDLGRIRFLEALERGKSGRISLLRITGEKRTLVIGKELEIRKTLSTTHLYSSAFTVETPDHDADGYPTRFILNGSGWGHGVGLCQIGAAVMGAKGIPYTDILAHYYPGAQIVTLLP